MARCDSVRVKAATVLLLALSVSLQAAPILRLSITPAPGGQREVYADVPSVCTTDCASSGCSASLQCSPPTSMPLLVCAAVTVESRVVIRTCAPNATETVAEVAALSDGCELRVGACTFTVAAPSHTDRAPLGWLTDMVAHRGDFAPDYLSEWRQSFAITTDGDAAAMPTTTAFAEVLLGRSAPHATPPSPAPQPQELQGRLLMIARQLADAASRHATPAHKLRVMAEHLRANATLTQAIVAAAAAGPALLEVDHHEAAAAAAAEAAFADVAAAADVPPDEAARGSGWDTFAHRVRIMKSTATAAAGLLRHQWQLQHGDVAATPHDHNEASLEEAGHTFAASGDSQSALLLLQEGHKRPPTVPLDRRRRMQHNGRQVVGASPPRSSTVHTLTPHQAHEAALHTMATALLETHARVAGLLSAGVTAREIFACIVDVIMNVAPEVILQVRER